MSTPNISEDDFVKNDIFRRCCNIVDKYLKRDNRMGHAAFAKRMYTAYRLYRQPMAKEEYHRLRQIDEL